jgi:hypothetical protein
VIKASLIGIASATIVTLLNGENRAINCLFLYCRSFRICGGVHSC